MEFWINTWAENQRLGESYNIKQNLEWERIRYLATLIHNVNCQKRNQMIKPEKLFPLPQDKYIKKEIPKSTREDFESFLEKVRNVGVKI
jgi:hypothetical protein